MVVVNLFIEKSDTITLVKQPSIECLAILSIIQFIFLESIKFNLSNLDFSDVEWYNLKFYSVLFLK